MSVKEGGKLKNGRRKSLQYSLKDGAAYSVMTGFGEQYFSPLAIELKATNMEIGMLASVPTFIAAVTQLFTSKVATHYKSRLRFLSNFIFLQALVWIPLMFIPYITSINNVSLLIFLVAAYFIFGQFVAPVWNSIMGDLVNEEMRGRFFGMRNRITGSTAFISLSTAGLVLSLYTKETILYGFTLIFFIAFIARLVSWHYIKKIEDPPVREEAESRFTFIQYAKKLKETNYGKFALYFALMNFSVYLASPFFTVYMLRDLQISYLEYTLITAAGALATFTAMNYWGRLADRFGNKRILDFCGGTLAIVPMLWLFSHDFAYLILIQLVAGFIWAGFNLSTLNVVYDNVRPENRTRVFAYHNVLTGTSIFLGALAGSILAHELTDPWIFYSSLQVLFLVSGIMRGASSIFFLPKIKERRKVEPISERDFFIKYNGTGPIIGLTYRAVTGLGKSIKGLEHDIAKHRPRKRK